MVQLWQRHLTWSLMKTISSTPLLAAQPLAEHENSHCNQHQGPELSDVNEIEHVKVVQEKKKAESNQDDRADGAVLAPIFERVLRCFSEILGLGGAHGGKSHVENEAGQQETQRDGGAVADVAVQSHDHGGEDDDVNEGLVVFAVVDGAEAREKAQDKGNARTADGFLRNGGGDRSRGSGIACDRRRSLPGPGSGNVAHHLGKAILAIK